MLRRRAVLLLASGIAATACSPAPPAPAAGTPGAVVAQATPRPLAPKQLAATLAPEATYTPAPTPTLQARESQDPTAVVVYAVSVLGGALSELAGQFMLSNSAATGVTYKFDTSTQLSGLIQQGAAADVFASADASQIQALQQANLLDSPDAVMVRDKLVIVVSRANPQNIQSLADLGGTGIRFIIPAPTTAAAIAFESTLQKASADAAYGADFAARADRNVLARDGNDAFAFGRVASGEVSAAVIYASGVDPQNSSKIQVIAVPDAVNTLMDFSIAVCKNAANAAGGRAFMSYVLTPPAQAVFARWGFTSLTP